MVILAGGFGTRLQTVTKDLPKPLANINGTPFIKYLIENLLKDGYNNFIFSLYHKSDKIIIYLEELKKTILKNVNILYSIENQPLGTGGAVKFAISKYQVSEYFLVVNADTLLGNGYNLVGLNNNNSIGLVYSNDTTRYGRVLLGANNIIYQFLEKNNQQISGYINAGVYNLNKNVFNNTEKLVFSLESEIFPNLIFNRQLNAVILDTDFIDIGIPEDYYKFCTLYKNK